jgi:hypothetical protein
MMRMRDVRVRISDYLCLPSKSASPPGDSSEDKIAYIYVYIRVTPVNEHGASTMLPDPMQLALPRQYAFLSKPFGPFNCTARFLIRSDGKSIRYNATSAPSLAIEPSSIYVSTSTSPLWNLSLEEL